MYRKKLLAAILCVAMIVSSSAGITAFAQDDILIESVDETSVELATEEGENDSVIEISEETEDSSVVEVLTDESDEGALAVSIEDAENANDDSSSDVVILEAEEEYAEPVYHSADKASASSCFEVVDGVLKLKEGHTIPRVATIPSEAKVIPADLFQDSAVIEKVSFEEDSELTTIEAGAFQRTSLQEIDIPKGVTEIANDTFRDSKLKTIAFEQSGKNLVSIGKSAFAGSYLVSIYSTGVKTVDEGAFSGCSSLSYATFPALTSVESSAFKNCKSLGDRLPFPDQLEYIGESAFLGCGYTQIDLSSCSKVVIEKMAFDNCENLKKVILPDELEVIKERTFYDCARLTDVRIGTKKDKSKTTVIETNAFGNCSLLEKITFFNVTKFESKALAGCYSLKTVIIYARNPEIVEDAFPLKSGLTMKGYSGTVQDYANKRGYDFESLDEKHPISVPKKRSHYEISPSVNKAAKGTKVTVKVIPEKGYILKSIEIKENEPTELKLAENKAEYQVFSFVMPDCEVTIEVEVVDAKSIITGNIAYGIRAVDGYATYKEGDTEYFDYVGRQSQLVVDAGGLEAGWLWNYKSSNTKAVTITETGLMTAVGKGEATITASLKTDSSKKISQRFKVKEKAEIESIEFVISNPDRGRVITEKDEEGKETKVVLFDKSVLGSGSKKFEVGIKVHAADDADRNLITTSSWSVKDSTIATVKKTSSTTNTNVITVKKTAKGETKITAKVKNPGSTKVAASASFVVRIIDPTPRLKKSTITVNSLSTIGTKIELTPQYGYEMLEDTLDICTKRVQNGITNYDPLGDLAINWDGESFYILNGTRSAFTKTYSSDTKQLYITGRVKGSDGSVESFVVPIKKLTVTKTALNPTITTKGKINLFYGNSDSLEQYGEVQITQSIKNTEVRQVKLVSADNHKKEGAEKVDSFANNFDIAQVDDQHFLVKRSSNPMAKKSGKDVVSGYIYIKYAGFKDFVKKPVTIPTVNTAPSLVLSQKSATVTEYGKKQVFKLQLLDKKTKQPISLENVKDIFYTAETTDNVFEDPYVEEDYIVIKVADTPKKGKAVFKIQMDDWSKSVKFTFTLSVTKNQPKVTFDTAKATLNKGFKSQSASITAGTNQKDDAKIVELSDIVYVGNANYSADAAKLIEGITLDATNNDTLNIKLPEENIAATTYKFKVTPTVKFSNNDEKYKLAKQVAFSVSVIEKNASLKLKTSPMVFNASFAGKETVESEYTLGNLPTGFKDFEAVTLDASSAEFTAPKNGPAFKDIAELDFAGGTAKVSSKASAILYGGKSYTYKVSGVKIRTGSDEPSTVADFNIVVKLNNATPKLTVTASGSINPIDPTSRIKYTAAISNVSTQVTEVKIWEKDEEGRWYGGTNTEDRYSEHFDVTLDANKSKIAYLTVKEGKAVSENKTYSIKLVYTLAVDDSKTYTADFTVTPKQVIPEIKTDKTTATIYSGADDRTVQVKISIVPGKTAATTIHAKLIAPVFASDTSAAIKEAFEIKSFDSETGIMTLDLVKPSAIKLDQEYTIDFVTQYENQTKNSTTNKFSLKVTVKK